ncbi:microtubule-binding protein TANGLED1 [Dendrobium catenatum]|uniref:microtubule-binding protein TANGLED1 n=1 Tax=Dendrobium catenatum TaxID=906689 RepID=UPI00109F4685|nr:microtubule-binding protein TANGLED1 [Dendrobium catenatum]
MVAKAPTIPNRMNTAINPILIRETIQKVDKCITRLQEIQFTVTKGTKIISGLKVSPRSTRGYIRTSHGCKQESLRLKTVAAKRSPASKFQEKANAEDWRRMSISAMLLNETVAEILQASKIVSNLSNASTEIDPRTPATGSRSRKLESTELRARRAREKQTMSRSRLETGSPVLRRSRSRISFKTTSPPNIREANMTGSRPLVSVNRVSPKNRPWKKKTVLFPNPLFHSTSPTSTHQKIFFKTRSPIAARPSQTPHKFLIKSQNATLSSQQKSFYKTRSPIARPSQTPHKFLIKSQHMTLSSHFKSKKAVPEVTISPVKTKGSASNQRRYSFSPSKLANRLVSPLKTRLSFHKVGGGLMTGLKQRPSFTAATKPPATRLTRGL